MNDLIPFLEQIHATIYQHIATNLCEGLSLEVVCENILKKLSELKQPKETDTKAYACLWESQIDELKEVEGYTNLTVRLDRSIADSWVEANHGVGVSVIEIELPDSIKER